MGKTATWFGRKSHFLNLTPEQAERIAEQWPEEEANNKPGGADSPQPTVDKD